MTVSLNNLNVAAISLNQTPLDWENNRNHILKAIMEAREKNVKLLCFPELCITGYGCEDTFLSLDTSRMALKILEDLLPHTQDLAIAVGLPLWHKEHLYNTICFISDTQIQGFVAKQNLAGRGVHYEPRWFKPWPKGLVVEYVLDFAGSSGSSNPATHHPNTYPLGDTIFDWHGIKIGFEICEDAWVTPRTAISLAQRGVDLILNPSASHFAFGKSNIRKNQAIEAASNFGVGYLYANLLGNEAGRIIYDGDTIIAAATEILASGPRFSFQDYVLTSTVIDIESLRIYRTKVVRKSRSMLQKKPTSKTMFSKKTKALFLSDQAFETSPYIKEEEFTRAVALALFDYLRKSKAHGFALNLSGGADSSACACLVYYMVLLGMQNLGAAQFLERLAWIPSLAKISETKAHLRELDELHRDDLLKIIMKNILYCLFQGTVNNSEATKQSAEALSHAISASFAEIEIDALVGNYCELIAGVLKCDLTFETDDIAMQNIQARVRAPSIWLLANLRHALVICPSNRSEASTGYCTMDGDTAGGICPIAGIDKYFLIQWLKWLEKMGPLGIGALPILKNTLALSPSAELRPLAKHQKDEEDLMPFEWLDFIERLFVRDKLSASEILIKTMEQFPKEKPKKLAAAIDRFFKLWTHNQWKRERLAPSFHLDDENVDPKTWCRFPILSGGYQRELDEMWAKVN